MHAPVVKWVCLKNRFTNEEAFVSTLTVPGPRVSVCALPGSWSTEAELCRGSHGLHDCFPQANKPADRRGIEGWPGMAYRSSRPRTNPTRPGTLLDKLHVNGGSAGARHPTKMRCISGAMSTISVPFAEVNVS